MPLAGDAPGQGRQEVGNDVVVGPPGEAHSDHLERDRQRVVAGHGDDAEGDLDDVGPAVGHADGQLVEPADPRLRPIASIDIAPREVAGRLVVEPPHELAQPAAVRRVAEVGEVADRGQQPHDQRLGKVRPAVDRLEVAAAVAGAAARPPRPHGQVQPVPRVGHTRAAALSTPAAAVSARSIRSGEVRARHA